MYADDTTLLFTASDPTTLQLATIDDLSKIAHWFELNKLLSTLNTKKTKFIILGNNHVLSNVNNIKLYYDNAAIERVDKFKYMDVILDPLLSW